jgi:DNA-binding transcriptional regulator YhcF (GntR family)
VLPFGYNDNNIGHAISKIEILSFFLANPHTRDTIKGFSMRLFMNSEQIEKVMEELVELGIVEKNGQKGKYIYRLKLSYSTLEEYLA